MTWTADKPGVIFDLPPELLARLGLLNILLVQVGTHEVEIQHKLAPHFKRGDRMAVLRWSLGPTEHTRKGTWWAHGKVMGPDLAKAIEAVVDRLQLDGELG